MKINRHNLKRIIFGYSIMAPALILMLLFFVWPFIQGLVSSFKTGYGVSSVFSGLKNYSYILHDPRFWNSLRVSVVFTVGFILLSGGISLLFAIIIAQKKRSFKSYLFFFFIPYISTPVISALIWTNMLGDPYGLFNVALSHIGLDTIPWLKDRNLAMISIIIIQVWYTIGYNTILFLAGIQAIPDEYYEAAEIDGCNFLQKIVHVIIPLVIPSIIFVTIISTLYGFINSYVLSSLITGGGPNDATNVLMNYIFELAFDRFDLGKANAVTMIIFILFLLLTYIQVNYQRKKFSGLY